MDQPDRSRKDVEDAAQMAAASGFTLTDLAAGAMQLHEAFTEWTKVGFTEAQAIYLVGCLCTGNPGKPPGI